MDYPELHGIKLTLPSQPLDLPPNFQPLGLPELAIETSCEDRALLMLDEMKEDQQADGIGRSLLGRNSLQELPARNSLQERQIDMTLLAEVSQS